MTKVQANIIGADVFTGPCHGRVEALFAHACTLLLTDGRRLTILCGSAENGMRIINVPDGGWRILRRNLDIGQSVLCSASDVSIGHVKLDWSEAGIWTSPQVPQSLPPGGWGQGLAVAASCLNDVVQQFEQPLLWATVHNRFEDLCRSLREGSNIETSVMRLIGAGPGLTPSGDDMLCGLMAGLNAAGDDRQSDLGNAIRTHEAATTATSRDYLDQACRGWWTSSLHSLFKEIERYDADKSGIEQAIGQLAQRGHSSGIDLATGLISGLSISECRVPNSFSNAAGAPALNPDSSEEAI